MIYGISLILLSVIAVPSLLLSRKPDAKEVLEKVAPYQGWIGIVCCFWGLWGIIQAVLHIGWLTSAPVWFLTLLAGSVVEAGLGFLLGFPLINKFFASNNTGTQEKAALLRTKVAARQGQLGILGILVGIWMIVASFLWSVA
ncbi:hypothetical protein A8C56_03655 [Niabella ginsenosidivorans]|uniref:DUF4149 domain-containing protein n=1 Tax=Niabella ginsenosidivorans TaxID=1176587 RepID=A0A1A9HYM7_9BACT|nr:hypothetical protein [Niabella ginsenosidivorans]ANH80195.1 hypothetical protein A8C56_03655 [Niabella ginsenosidivorans]